MVKHKPLLSCRGVYKYFGAMAAVNNLSFDVQSGEIFGISGPNGAGKTTLFEVISGLDPADEGSILFDDEDITRRLPQKICQAGLARVFQSNACFDSQTVRENIAVGAVYGSATGPVVPLRFRSKTRERIERILDEVGLSDKGDEIASNLPVLDRKRLMFASALSSEPKLLLLDEPVGGLNPKEMESMISLVSAVTKQGITVILIEHVMRFMVQLATRILIMHHGEEIFVGSPKDLPQDKKVAEVYLGEAATKGLAKFLESRA